MSDNPYEAPKNRDEQQPATGKRSRLLILVLFLALGLIAVGVFMYGSVQVQRVAAPPVPSIRPQEMIEDVRTIGPEAQP